MSRVYSIEVDKYNPTALTHCLKRLEKGIPDYEFDWRIIVNAGGIDYGVYLNINVDRNEIEICNQPSGEGDDSIDDVLELFDEDEDEEEG